LNDVDPNTVRRAFDDEQRWRHNSFLLAMTLQFIAEEIPDRSHVGWREEIHSHFQARYLAIDW